MKMRSFARPEGDPRRGASDTVIEYLEKELKEKQMLGFWISSILFGCWIGTILLIGKYPQILGLVRACS